MLRTLKAIPSDVVGAATALDAYRQMSVPDCAYRLYAGGRRTRSVGVWARRGPPDDRQDRP
jgi:hypothetical protein